MCEKTTERRLKDEFVVLKKDLSAVFFKRDKPDSELLRLVKTGEGRDIRRVRSTVVWHK
jgi:hypothetical protein